MNDEQKKQIKILRYQGIGYKKIAESMGLSRDVNRGYCKRHGLSGRATELVLNHDKDEKFIKEITHVYCLSCGTKLEQKGSIVQPNVKGNLKRIILKYINFGVITVEKNIYLKEYRSGSFVVMTAMLERFFKEEDAAEILGKIMKRKKVDYVPKWLEELMLSYLKND